MTHRGRRARALLGGRPVRGYEHPARALVAPGPAMASERPPGARRRPRRSPVVPSPQTPFRGRCRQNRPIVDMRSAGGRCHARTVPAGSRRSAPCGRPVVPPGVGYGSSVGPPAPLGRTGGGCRPSRHGDAPSRRRGGRVRLSRPRRHHPGSVPAGRLHDRHRVAARSAGHRPRARGEPRRPPPGPRKPPWPPPVATRNHRGYPLPAWTR